MENRNTSAPTTQLRVDALNAVSLERARQLKLWGAQADISFDRWLVILAEELGEVAKEVCDRTSVPNLRTELVQVAAVAVAIIEAIDSGKEFEHGCSENTQGS